MEGRTDRDVQLLSRALKRSVELYVPYGNHHNFHFVAKSTSGIKLFIKLFRDKAYAERSIKIDGIVRRLGLRTPQLHDFGELSDGRQWLAYEWCEFTPFVETETNIAEAASMLGVFHNETRAPRLAETFPSRHVTAGVDHRINQIAAHDVGTADKLRKIWERYKTIPEPYSSCLINGDVSWRNFGIDSRGNVIWYDWECVSRGSPLLDFAKLIDIEFTDSFVKNTFLNAYHRYATVLMARPKAMTLVRFWCAVGAINYGIKYRDDNLRRHGCRVIKQLEHRYSVN